MASIHERIGQDGQTTYQVKVRLKGHRPVSATFRRKTDAKRWAQQTETKIREGKFFREDKARQHTLAELIDEYVENVLPQMKDTAAPARQLAWWRERLGHLYLVDVTPAELSAARDDLAKEPVDWAKSKRQAPTRRSPATVNRYLAALSQTLTYAVKDLGWLEHNPVSQVRKLKESRGRVRFLDEDERERLLEGCRRSPQPLLYPAVVLSLATGGRQGEVLGLKWKHVDFERGRVTFYDTKNGEPRSVPLLGHARAVLEDLHRKSQKNVSWVFPGRGGRKRIDLRAPFQEALKQAEITDFRWHDLRHSAASYLAMNGATLAEIAAVLGHKQLDMVRRYSHLTEQHTARVLAGMNEAVFGQK